MKAKRKHCCKLNATKSISQALMKRELNVAIVAIAIPPAHNTATATITLTSEK